MFEAPWSYPEKINIDQQINELKRERALRVGVYTKMIRSKSLRQSAAEYQMGAIDACIATLEYMRDNRTVIVTAVAEQREIENNIAGRHA
jgi:hypothetical protein